MALPQTEQELKGLLDVMKQKNASKQEMKIVIDGFFDRQKQAPEQNLGDKIMTDIRSGEGVEAFQEGETGLKGVGTGIVRRLGQAAGTGEKILALPFKGAGKIKEFVTGEEAKGVFSSDRTTSAEDIFGGEEGFKGKTGAEKTGATIFDIVSILAGGASGRAVGAAGTAKLATQAPKATKLRPAISKAIPVIGESLGATSAFTTAKEGELPTAKEALIGAAIDFGTLGLSKAFSGSSSKAFKLLDDLRFPKGKEAIERAGVDVKASNMVQDLAEKAPQLKGFAEQALAQSEKAAKRLFEFGDDAGKVRYAADLVADNIKEVQGFVGGKLKTLGSKIGDASQTLKSQPKISTKSAYDQLVSALREMNVKVRKTGLDFSNSDVEGIAADQALLNDAYEFLRKRTTGRGAGKFPEVNPRDMLSKIRNYGNKLYAGRGEVTQSKRPIEVVRKAMRGEIDNLSGEYGGLAKQYAELLDVEEAFNRTIRQEGEQATQYVRRLLSRASGKSENLMALIEKVSDKYGVEAGKDIAGKSAIAATFDELVGATPPQGFKGQIAEAGKEIIEKGPKQGIISRGVDALSEKVFPTPDKVEAIQEFLQMADNPQALEQGKSIVDEIINAEIGENTRALFKGIRLLLQQPGSE